MAYQRASHKTAGLLDESYDSKKLKDYVAATKEARPQLRLFGWGMLFRYVASTQALRRTNPTEEEESVNDGVVRILSHPAAPIDEVALAAKIAMVMLVLDVPYATDEFHATVPGFVLRHCGRALHMLSDGACGDEDEGDVEAGLLTLLQVVKVLDAITGGVHVERDRPAKVLVGKLRDFPVAANEQLRCMAACLTGENDDEECSVVGKEVQKRIRVASDTSQLESLVWVLAMMHELDIKGALDIPATLEFVGRRSTEVGGGKEGQKALADAIKTATDVVRSGTFPTTSLSFGKLRRASDRIVELDVKSIVHHEVLRALRKLLGESYYPILMTSEVLAAYFGAEVVHDISNGEFYARQHVPSVLRKQQRREREQRDKGRQAARDSKQHHQEGPTAEAE